MAPPSPLATVETNRDPKNILIHPALKTESKGPRVYRFSDAVDRGIPYIPGIMNITVGAEPGDERTWELPKALLSRHSDIFKSIITADNTVSEVQLPTISPNAFADFASYMQSSIYSTNTKFAGYRSIRAHADACLLAAKLEADKYWEAAMRQLYSLFLPLAQSRRSDAKQSFIRAGDIEYICINATAENLRCTVTINSARLASNNPLDSPFKPTLEDGLLDASPPPRKGHHSHDVGAMKGLRTLFFDALASHWTQKDVIYIDAQNSPRGGGFNTNDVPGDSTTWRQVCDAYPDFRTHVAKTTGVLHSWRTALLKHVDLYLDPVGLQFIGGPGGGSGHVAIKEEGVDNVETERIEDVDKIKREEGEGRGELEMETATRRPKLTLKLTGLKRGNSGDGIAFAKQALNYLANKSEDATKSDEEALGDGEVNEGIDSDESTIVDGESDGEEEVPRDGEREDEEMEGMDAGIEQEQASAGY